MEGIKDMKYKICNNKHCDYYNHKMKDNCDRVVSKTDASPYSVICPRLGTKTKYIECGCHTGLLQLEYIDDDQELNVAFYRYGHTDSRHSLMVKIGWIWKILTTGIPYADAIVLEKDEVDELKDFLEEL